MKHFYFAKFLLIFLIFIDLKAIDKSAVVYYADDVPYSLVGIHDYIILEPSNVNTYTHGFKRYRQNIYAYISVGEATNYNSYFKELKRSWFLGKNEAWKSKVMDIANEEYHQFLIQKVIKPLYERGFKNFFFDTMDSYMIVSYNKKDQQRFQKGLISFIKKFKNTFPNSKLIINRGFEIIDFIHDDIEAFLFESFYYGLDSKLKYKKVSQSDRLWLREKLKKVKRYNIPIIAVDYLPNPQSKKSKQIIKMLKKEGFIGYIGTKDLQSVGISSKNAIKREVLLLCNPLHKSDTINDTSAHRIASVALEYLGFTPVIKNIQDFKKDFNTKNYAAIIVWFDKKLDDYENFSKWITKKIKDGQKVIFFSEYSLDPSSTFLEDIGIKVEKNLSTKKDISKNKIIYQDKMIGYEINPSINYLRYMITPKSKKNLLTYKNSKSQTSTLAAIMPWGGYVLIDSLYYTFLDSDLLVIDLFQFYKEALEIDNFPIPDVTTENGRRLFFVHIDGDGSANKVEGKRDKYSIELIYEEFLKRYKIPQSISIVESEIAPYGLYPNLSARLEKTAKKIYELPYIDAATHTFSHPFFWKKIKNYSLDKNYHLKVKNYDFYLPREIKGSLNYINTKLLPKNKKRANTIFWTGDCMPQEKTLEYIYKNGINNLNGGDTEIRNSIPWISRVQPYGIKIGDYYQIYTAQQNENIYTNDWYGPFWGFKQVIQTFKLTNKPKRLKAMNIYYHFYSGSKLASIKALKEVYEWAIKQESMPIFATEYSPKVIDFYDASIAKVNNYWLIKGLKDLKTIRVAHSMGFVDMDKSVGVVGKKSEKGFDYIHLAPNSTHLLYLSKKPLKNQNYLIHSNAKVTKYKKSGKNISFELSSYVDLKFSYRVAKNCSIKLSNKAASIKKKDLQFDFSFKNTKVVNVDIFCR